MRALIHTRVDYCNDLPAAGSKYTCTRTFSPSSEPPPDSFCNSHIVHPSLTSCDDSCTGSKCQIASVSNCVRLCIDAYMDSLLITCPISANLPRCMLIWDHLWHSNGRCQSPGWNHGVIGPRGFYFASSSALNALPVHLRDPELSLYSFKCKLKYHFFHNGYIFHINFCSSCAPTR